MTAVDVAAGRVLEPHLDAVAILAQAGDEAARQGRDCPDLDDADFEGAWGVFAAEAPGLRLEAKEAADGWILLRDPSPGARSPPSWTMPC